jgi:hypothetical protein
VPWRIYIAIRLVIREAAAGAFTRSLDMERPPPIRVAGTIEATFTG